MDAPDLAPGLLAVADQVYAGLIDEWLAPDRECVDQERVDPSSFTAEFEARLRAALES
jgi:hypothetical protein